MALGIYVHVPFCAARCGYCDFNTYLPHEATREGYLPAVVAELDLARSRLGARTVDTVFLGGGTPTLLAPEELGQIVAAIDERFGLTPGAEVTAEANPESLGPESFEALLAAGITRLSIGMQSAARHVLAVLDRVHTPGAAVRAALAARAAGFGHVSLDLIYGTPGETDDDWRMTLDTALSAQPDHISAYGLIVEPGTALAARVKRGVIEAPDDDAMATRYEIADETLSAAGLSWYELCSWSRGEESRCRHNIGYWRGGDWWGVGPGAHSHLRGVRWWNERLPSRWMAALAAGQAPAAGSERPDARESALEEVMLGLRLVDGLDLALLDDGGRAEALLASREGLLELTSGRAVLTRRGRLLADAVVRRLTP